VPKVQWKENVISFLSAVTWQIKETHEVNGLHSPVWLTVVNSLQCSDTQFGDRKGMRTVKKCSYYPKGSFSETVVKLEGNWITKTQLENCH